MRIFFINNSLVDKYSQGKMFNFLVISRSVYSTAGSAVEDSKLNFSKDLNLSNPHEQSAFLGDDYFRGMNAFLRKPQIKGIVPKLLRSPGTAGAACEVVAGGLLWRCFKGPATLVNWGTSIGEFVNVAISESKIKKPIKEECLASIQILAGVLGFGGFLKERLFAHEESDFSEIPLYEKIGLSSSYILNTFFMVTGAIEKSLLSMVCKNRPNTEEGKNKIDDDDSTSEYRDCLISAKQDRRCTIECSIASVIPWVMNVGPVKFVLDLLMPYQAIKDGLELYVDRFKEGKEIHFLPKKLQTPKMFELMEFVNDPRTLLGRRTKNEDEKFTLIWPFNLATKFLLGREDDKGGKGSSGFRNSVIKPFYRALGALSPNYYLNKEGNIVVEFEDLEAKADETSHEQVPAIEQNTAGSLSSVVEPILDQQSVSLIPSKA